MSDSGRQFTLRYVGDRFSDAKLPLDVLGDLSALRDLIVALAKQEFRSQNPDRKRVPQGFDRSISFSLRDIRDGSAVPVLALDNEVAQQNLPNIGNEMEEVVARAYERVGKIFDDAGADKFPPALPQDAIRALSKLGANIQENEWIEFQGTTGANGSVVVLDAFRRKRLLTRVRETYTIEFEGVGSLTGIDSSHNAIQVETERFGEIRLNLDGASMPADQFDGNLHGLVEFSISVALDANDAFKGVEEVYSVDLVRPYGKEVIRCIDRIQGISKLERGWLGEDQGERLVHLSAMQATRFIFMRADLADLFRIFPTEDGGVSIEFDRGHWSFSVEISPAGSVEMDGSERGGEIFELRTYDQLSEEFLSDFDEMVALSNV